MFNSRRLIAWITCLSYVLAAPLGAFAKVICVGEDGHVAIEHAVNGVCTDDHNAEIHSIEINGEEVSGEEVSRDSHDESHCGGCADFELIEQVAGFKPMGDSPSNKKKIVKPTLTPLALTKEPTFTLVNPGVSLEFKNLPSSIELQTLRSVIQII